MQKHNRLMYSSFFFPFAESQKPNHDDQPLGRTGKLFLETVFLIFFGEKFFCTNPQVSRAVHSLMLYHFFRCVWKP